MLKRQPNFLLQKEEFHMIEVSYKKGTQLDRKSQQWGLHWNRPIMLKYHGIIDSLISFHIAYSYTYWCKTQNSEFYLFSTKYESNIIMFKLEYVLHLLRQMECWHRWHPKILFGSLYISFFLCLQIIWQPFFLIQHWQIPLLVRADHYIMGGIFRKKYPGLQFW